MTKFSAGKERCDYSQLLGPCETDENGEHYTEACCSQCGRCSCEAAVYVGDMEYGSICPECREEMDDRAKA